MPNAHATEAGALHRARRREIVDESRIDDVVHELFHALKNQLARYRNAERRISASRTKSLAANGRMVLAMEHALERLLAVEKQRKALREMRSVEYQDDARAKLIERLDRLLFFQQEEERRKEEEEWRKAQVAIDTLSLMGTA